MHATFKDRAVDQKIINHSQGPVDIIEFYSRSVRLVLEHYPLGFGDIFPHPSGAPELGNCYFTHSKSKKTLKHFVVAKRA